MSSVSSESTTTSSSATVTNSPHIPPLEELPALESSGNEDTPLHTPQSHSAAEAILQTPTPPSRRSSLTVTDNSSYTAEGPVAHTGSSGAHPPPEPSSSKSGVQEDGAPLSPVSAPENDSSGKRNSRANASQPRILGSKNQIIDPDEAWDASTPTEGRVLDYSLGTEITRRASTIHCIASED